MGTEIAIDKDRLRELALDPKNGVKEIVAGLGMSDPTFYQHLDRDPELKRIYQEAREEMRAARNGSGNGHVTSSRATAERTTSKRKYSKRATKAKRASRDTPPRKGHSKAEHKDLFRKLRLEFDHIETYGEVSEHFNELREQLEQVQ